MMHCSCSSTGGLDALVVGAVVAELVAEFEACDDGVDLPFVGVLVFVLISVEHV